MFGQSPPVWQRALGNQAYGELRENRAIEGGPLTIAGKTYPQGLGTHAISEIPYPVRSGMARLRGKVGMDDGQKSGQGRAQFRIFSGNAVLWESPAITTSEPAVSFDVAVLSEHHRMISLQCDDLGENSYDHADWVDLEWTKGEANPAVASTSARVLKGSDFGLMPGVRDDQCPSMHRAIQALREAPGSKLLLENGEYHFHAKGTLRRHFYISNHDQSQWRPVCIPLVDLRNFSTLVRSDSVRSVVSSHFFASAGSD